MYSISETLSNLHRAHIDEQPEMRDLSPLDRAAKIELDCMYPKPHSTGKTGAWGEQVPLTDLKRFGLEYRKNSRGGMSLSGARQSRIHATRTSQS